MIQEAKGAPARSGRCGNIAYGASQIFSESNEDRYCAIFNHFQSGLEELSSFGVFDGHQGVSQFL
jgi:serine/threonine protein phosphatase PrpC